MADSHEELYLVVRDKKNDVLDTVTIPKSAFIMPTGEIQELISKTSKMAAGPRNNCEDYTDDSVMVI